MRDRNDAIDAWLAANAIPLNADARDGDAVLERLKRILDGVSIVGLGEPTHGTKQFMDIRLWLTGVLVTRLGFNAIAIEASHSATQRINTLVLGGHDDLPDAVTALGSVMWDTEEFAMLLRWLRRYNGSVDDSRRVRLWGLDIYNTQPGRDRVLAFLRQVAPTLVARATEAFTQIGAAEAKGYLGGHRLITPKLKREVETLSQSFAHERSTWTRLSSPEQYKEIEREMQVILQSVVANLPHISPAGRRQKGINVWARSQFMASNLVASIGARRSEAKIVLWAHNLHVRVGSPDPTVPGLVPNMGNALRQSFGSGYYAFGLELNHGTYLARVWLVADYALGDFSIGTIPAAPADSVPWHLSRLGIREFLLDFRHSPMPHSVRDWLNEPHTMHELGWARGDPPLLYTQVPAGLVYDGLVFIQDSSPTTPTANALITVATRAAS